jgi:hypothetical protein
MNDRSNLEIGRALDKRRGARVRPDDDDPRKVAHGPEEQRRRALRETRKKTGARYVRDGRLSLHRRGVWPWDAWPVQENRVVRPDRWWEDAATLAALDRWDDQREEFRANAEAVRVELRGERKSLDAEGR